MDRSIGHFLRLAMTCWRLASEGHHLWLHRWHHLHNADGHCTFLLHRPSVWMHSTAESKESRWHIRWHTWTRNRMKRSFGICGYVHVCTLQIIQFKNRFKMEDGSWWIQRNYPHQAASTIPPRLWCCQSSWRAAYVCCLAMPGRPCRPNCRMGGSVCD